MNKTRILIADDNKANQLIAGKFLNQIGIETDFAKNGQEAIDKVSNQDFHLILMDLNMPVMTGLDACKNIRNMEDPYFKNLPIIAVTSSFAEDVKLQMEEYGLTDYMTKPINPVSIKKIVSKHLPEAIQSSTQDLSKIKLVCECPEEKFDCSRLFEITNGNTDMVRDIIKTIIEILPTEIKIIQDAIRTKDYIVAKRSAHKIKPNYEYVGLNELASIAERIEESAGKIQPNVLGNLINKLSQRTSQIVPYLGKCELKRGH